MVIVIQTLSQWLNDYRVVWDVRWTVFFLFSFSIYCHFQNVQDHAAVNLLFPNFRFVCMISRKLFLFKSFSDHQVTHVVTLFQLFLNISCIPCNCQHPLCHLKLAAPVKLCFSGFNVSCLWWQMKFVILSICRISFVSQMFEQGNI